MRSLSIDSAVPKYARRQEICPEGEGRLDQWFRAYYAPLVRWVGSRIRDRDAAEDICQSAFIYLRELSNRGEIQHPRAVLYKTAAWLAANEIRRRRRAAYRSQPIDDLQSPDVDDSRLGLAPSLDSAFATRQEALLALDAIRSMPEKMQRVFQMSRLEGRTYGEIALALNLSKSSVEKYMMAALSSMRAVKATLE